MEKPIHLQEHGIRLFTCRLFNHDYLWFSSYEISKRSVTLPIIHNYALSYSFSDMSYGVCHTTAPRYEADLALMPLYCTPALSTMWNRTRVTYNAVNDCSLRTDDAPRGVNSPDLGWRNYIDPVYPTDVRDARSLGFGCYVFTFDGSVPKGVTRVGKKGAVVRVLREELVAPVAVFRMESVRPGHPINPLDVAGEIGAYDPVNIPPHLLLRVAEVRNDWFVFSEGHVVHVPKRVIERCTA